MNGLERYRLLLMTLDPVHVGAGGYRLGRVDMSIVREPGTNVPKIPGTSLSGVARSYAATRLGRLQCAGQKNHCGAPTCPICYTFGSVSAQEGQRAYRGTVSIFDAAILFFPVYSMQGPVWVTTVDRLREAGFDVGELPPQLPEELLFTGTADRLNLGWLMLSARHVAPPRAPQGWEQSRWTEIEDRLVLVSERLFGVVVNSNLEVRTSVSIDPSTGAAESGALFTYEAIPRATFMVLDMIQHDYRHAFPSETRLKTWQDTLSTPDSEPARELLAKWFPNYEKYEKTEQEKAEQDRKSAEEWVSQALGRASSRSWQTPHDVVDAGLELAKWMGVGGMGTRGFGRLDIVSERRLGWEEA